MPNIKHDKHLVARIKGALMAGLGPKLLAHWTKIPLKTIEKWRSESFRGAIEPDMTAADDVREALLGRFVGRESGR